MRNYLIGKSSINEGDFIPESCFSEPILSAFALDTKEASSPKEEMPTNPTSSNIDVAISLAESILSSIKI